MRWPVFGCAIPMRPVCENPAITLTFSRYLARFDPGLAWNKAAFTANGGKPHGNDQPIQVGARCLEKQAAPRVQRCPIPEPARAGLFTNERRREDRQPA